MHHVTVDRWSRQESIVHSRDPRAKVAALLLYLIVLATTPAAPTALLFSFQMFSYLALILSGIAAARLPVGALELRAMVVLPFSATFALITWFAGDPSRAGMLVAKSYLSALAVLLVVATTPMPLLMRGLEAMGAPRIFGLLVQFLYRYLFVISEQAQHMRLASSCRMGTSQRNASDRFRAAAGAVSVLFARSHARAEGIHRAMLSRGFQGRFAISSGLRLRPADYAFLFACVVAILAIRLAFPAR